MMIINDGYTIIITSIIHILIISIINFLLILIIIVVIIIVISMIITIITLIIILHFVLKDYYRLYFHCWYLSGNTLPGFNIP